MLFLLLYLQDFHITSMLYFQISTLINFQIGHFWCFSRCSGKLHYVYKWWDPKKPCFPWYGTIPLSGAFRANMTQRFSAPSFGFSSSSWHSGWVSSGWIYFHRIGLDERAVLSHPVILGSFEREPVLHYSWLRSLCMHVFISTLRYN